MNWRPSQYSRYQNDYQDLKSHYRSEDRYRPVDNHPQLRNYASRRFPNREQRESNYRNSASNYRHSGNNYYNYDNYYDDFNYSRDNYNHYVSCGYDDLQPGRSREESYRPDRVLRSKFSSASNRPKPYSYQRGRR